MSTSPSVPPSYKDHERRHHRAIVTENTEYHLHDELCVGVRERHSGVWMPDHPALGARLERVQEWAAMLSIVGNSAVFMLGRGAILATSPVRDIVRPEREAPNFYLRHSGCSEPGTRSGHA
jgi:hypothetical protein